MKTMLTEHIYIYNAGGSSHSRHNPRVINGEIPIAQAVIIRTKYVRWQYWTMTIVDRWISLLARHVPGARWLVFEVYDRHFYPLYEELEVTIFPIPLEKATPHWQEFVQQRASAYAGDK